MMNNDQNCVNIKIFPTAELQFYLLKGKPSKKKNKKKCEGGGVVQGNFHTFYFMPRMA